MLNETDGPDECYESFHTAMYELCPDAKELISAGNTATDGPQATEASPKSSLSLTDTVQTETKE